MTTRGRYYDHWIKVGDTIHVKDNTEIDWKIISGSGKVVNMYVNNENQIFSLFIDWDNVIDGHNCDGCARNHHGWNVFGRYLDKLIFDDIELNKFHEE